MWGSTGYSQGVDISLATVKGTLVSQLLSKEYLENTLQSSLKGRGQQILKKKQSSAILSACYATVQHLRDWWHGSEDWVNMGVISDGTIVPQGICISLPVKCSPKAYHILQDLELTPR